MKNYFKNITISLSFIFLSTSVFSQVKDAELKALIDKQQYTFNVISATTQGGRTIQLTSEYELQVAKDSLISFLPFFGRAFSAPYSSTEGGIKFTSKDFSYALSSKKKAYNISIKPKDVDTVNSLQLIISESGYGTLSVISNQRAPISFYGYVISSDKK